MARYPRHETWAVTNYRPPVGGHGQGWQFRHKRLHWHRAKLGAACRQARLQLGQQRAVAQVGLQDPKWRRHARPLLGAVVASFVIASVIIVFFFDDVAFGFDWHSVAFVHRFDWRGFSDAGFFAGISQAFDCGHDFTIIQTHDAHALGSAAQGWDVFDADADQLAFVGNQDQVILFRHDADRRQIAVARRGFDADDAFAWLLPGRAFDAVSVAPDVFIGVTQRLMLGVTSSNRALSSVSAGGGACFGSVTSGCVAKLANVGVDATWQARAGALAWAPHARLVMRQFSPSKPAVMFGARVRWHHGRWAVVADPYVQLGLANTDRGNRHALHVPLWLLVQPTCRWSIGLRTGFESEFAVIRDGWHGVLGGVVTAAVSTSIDIELSGGVRSAFGPQNTSKDRALALAISVRR